MKALKQRWKILKTEPILPKRLVTVKERNK